MTDATKTFPWATLLNSEAMQRRIAEAELERRRYQRARGQQNGNCKLSDRQVKLMHQRFNEGVSKIEISRQFDIPYVTVKSILSGRTRKIDL